MGLPLLSCFRNPCRNLLPPKAAWGKNKSVERGDRVYFCLQICVNEMGLSPQALQAPLSSSPPSSFTAKAALTVELLYFKTHHQNSFLKSF